MRKGFLAIVAAMGMVGVSSVTHAQAPNDYLIAKFKGRSGAASEDQRVDEHALRSWLGPGPKTGCHGDTLSAGVTLDNVRGQLSGSAATITVDYAGKYTRQGWITPCVQSPPPNGREDRDVRGTYVFTLTQRPFENVTLSWGGASNLGEVDDAGHMSNVFAIRAVQQAIQSAL